jgi:hypothetical protein
MKPKLYQRIMLTRDVPEENLKEGDLAWLIIMSRTRPVAKKGR